MMIKTSDKMSRYFKPTVKIEPLIWQWYAWFYLIPPHTASCNIVQRHLKIMQSFVESPEVHQQAVKNPRLRGGPFSELEESHVETIKELITETTENCRDLIKLEASLKECDKILQNSAKGNSLESLYSSVPDNLRGIVELVYDINNHPSIRIIEHLSYRKFYSDTHQSLMIYDSVDDYRPFILSTPRLKLTNEINFKIKFSDKNLDLIFNSREASVNYNSLTSTLGISNEIEPFFKNFFTEKAPRISINKNYSGDSVRIRYFGHACVLLQTKQISILIDPLISYESDSSLQRFTYLDLPDSIDYVLLTHNHQDHAIIETLIQLRYKIKTIVFPMNTKGSLIDPSLKLILNKLGFNHLVSLDDFERLELSDGYIMGLPFLGEHSDLNIQTKLAHYIELKGRKFLFAADSNNIEPRLYDYIYEEIGEVDALFIGMECDGAPLSWLYGPLFTVPPDRQFSYSRKLSGSDFNKAWKIAKILNCKQAYIYAMGQEPWLGHIMALNYTNESVQIKESDKFIEECWKNNIYAERLYAMKEWNLP